MANQEPERGFGSDNHAGVHPEVLAALATANQGHVHGYGADPYTDEALAALHRHFGPDCEILLVLTGTGANVLAVAAACRPYQAVVCPASAHLQTDECGAPERFAGCKLLTVPTPDGRLTPALLAAAAPERGDEHQVQPALVSISQATELGTVYSPAMVAELAAAAHARGWFLHVDGARLANAAARLGCGLGDLAGAVGVDVLSFGGTKNGMLMGEALVVFHPDLRPGLRRLRKQAMQLASKMRFLSVQFTAMLRHDLWRRSAAHANAMADLLAAGLRQLPGVRLTQPVEANAVFVQVPEGALARLPELLGCYVWDAARCQLRLMTSFDTTAEDVERCLALVRRHTEPGEPS